MAAKNKETFTELEELVRLLAVLVRQTLGSQGEAVSALNRAGFGTSRIAQLLGTTPNTVNQYLQRGKRKR